MLFERETEKEFCVAGSTFYQCSWLQETRITRVRQPTFLLQHSYTLSPRLSAQLLWSRFINVHGRAGKNIAGDLHMEHLNKIAKEAIRFQGANKTEKAIERIGRAIGTLSPVLENFDSHNNVPTTSSRQRKPDAQRDIQLVVTELVNCDAFKVVTGRKYTAFPRPKMFSMQRTRKMS